MYRNLCDIIKNKKVVYRMDLKELRDFYTKKLLRKENLIKEYIEEKNSIDGFMTSKREIAYNVLYAEIQLIRGMLENIN